MTEEQRQQIKADYHAALIAEAMAYLDDGGIAALIPDLIPGLRRYLEHRIETGGFLRACLENDWFRAVSLAHPLLRMPQMKALRDVITTFPSEAWGSPQNVAAWLTKEDASVAQEEAG